MKTEIHLQEDELRFNPSEDEIRKMMAFALEESDPKKGIEKIVIEPTTDIINSGEIGDNGEKVLLGYRVQSYGSRFVWDRYISRANLG